MGLSGAFVALSGCAWGTEVRRWQGVDSPPAIVTPTEAEIANEVEIADRLRRERADRQTLPRTFAIRRINGPKRYFDRLTRVEGFEANGPVCAAVASLVQRYQDYGFDGCTSWKFIGRSGRPVFIVDYQDRYKRTDEYQSMSGHSSYRPPFAGAPGLISYESLCGKITAFDLVMADRTMRLAVQLDDTRQCGSVKQ